MLALLLVFLFLLSTLVPDNIPLLFCMNFWNSLVFLIALRFISLNASICGVDDDGNGYYEDIFIDFCMRILNFGLLIV